MVWIWYYELLRGTLFQDQQKPWIQEYVLLGKIMLTKEFTLPLVTLILPRHAPGSTYFIDPGTTFYLKTKSHTYTYPYT